MYWRMLQLFPGFPDLNPFDLVMKSLSDKILGLFAWITKILQTLILQAPDASNNQFLAVLYGEAWGLSSILIIGVTITIISVAMFWQKRLKSIPEVLGIALLIGVGSPFYWTFIDTMATIGNSLSEAVMKVPTGSSTTLLTPGSPLNGSVLVIANAGNILGLVVFGFIAFFLAAIQTNIVGVYIVMIILVKFFGLIVLALSPLGNRAKQVLEWLTSLAIVSLIFGRLFIIVVLQFGLLVNSIIPGSAIFNLINAEFVACIGSIALIFIVHKQVVKQEIVGKVFSLVRGNVTVTERGGRNIDVDNVNIQHADTLKPPKSKSGDGLVKGTAEAAAGAALAAGVKKVAGSVHPAVGAAVIASDHLFRNRKSKRTASTP